MENYECYAKTNQKERNIIEKTKEHVTIVSTTQIDMILADKGCII